jgi:predicted acyl esterase
MSKPYEGSHQQYDVVCHANTMISMRDGVCLATDIYVPALDGKPIDGEFPVILERTPYDKSSPKDVSKGKYFTRRGYVCVIQDVRGRFKSEGEWYPFAKEAPDGYDTVQWLGNQAWSNGMVGTMGGSYSGSDQAALATLNPSHLATMVISVGASNYYHSSMRHNGALEQRFLIYAFNMAITSKEAEADPSLRTALQDVFTKELDDIVRKFPLKEGSTILRRLPSYEKWAIDILTTGEYTEYWKQRGYAISEYYDEHADVPTLYLGGWYDSYARNTCDSYEMLSKIKKSPQYLLMGPWTHGGFEVTYAGDLEFGTESQINQNDVHLAWFDYYLKGMLTEVSGWSPVQIFTMGKGKYKSDSDQGIKVLGAANVIAAPTADRVNHGGYWRGESNWPLPGTDFVPYYLCGDGTLSEKQDLRHSDITSYRFDPTNPVPTIGGGISAASPIMEPGAFDQRGRAGFFNCVDRLPLNARHDVVSFQTDILDKDVEVTGPIEMHLWASSSAVDTDFTAKLIDVYSASIDYPEGLSINLTDSIIRARYRNGWERPEMMKPGEVYEFVFKLYPTSNIFVKGHRIRLDISSSNWPRFDVNPNTGAPLGHGSNWQVAVQTIYHNGTFPSHVVLPVQDNRNS